MAKLREGARALGHPSAARRIVESLMGTG